VVSRRINPVDVVVAFFESAPLEQAQTVLVIARGILARRQPKAKATKAARKGSPLLDDAEAALAAHNTKSGGDPRG
jgi:hypothetical protein